jgi:hypothetical protein
MAANNAYGQEQPTEQEAVNALAELVGHSMAEGIWELSVRELNLRRPLTDPADLRLVADNLMLVGDLLRVAGRSTKVRVITYEALSRTVTS